ncbi:MAG: glycine cleavage system protein H [Desulfovibrio sp.]|jgi:glycine cleavage system H protein|nr:glycine cleavage system protein H [Desulfovibrio sp.]MBQ1420890.1 glycine cleavage system protein H [Desulfovibrio sp.]MBQ1845211.1 glycine cleavage system protein H [Desulfovibrio sp.]MBQ4125918.1 glycine cleavage system protein H [Desulfovibrio sp.]
MKIADYEVPEDLYYDDYHFWCRPEGDEVVIGMDDFAQRLAGDIVFVQLPFVGKAVTRGKKLSKVESGKWLGTVYGPADGEITAVNEELEENPGLINEDCYGKGWMYRMRPADMGQIESLRHGGKDVLEPWIMQDVEKYKQD